MDFDPQYSTNAKLKMLDAVQQNMLHNWVAMVASAFASKPFSPPNKQAFQAILETWHDTVQNGIRLMTLNSDPAMRDVASKIFSSQFNMLRFIELTAQVWAHVAIALHNGEDWEAVLNHQLDQTRKQWAGQQAAHHKGGQQALWQIFITEGCTLTAFFPETLRQRMLDYHSQPYKPTTFIDLATLNWESYPSSIGHFGESGGGEFQVVYEALQQSFSVWVDMQQASEAYQRILLDTWLDAYGKFLHDLGRLAQDDEGLESVRDFLNRWIATADEAFKQSFHTKAFAQAQAQLVNSIMLFRKRQLQLSDAIMRLYGLPTRREVDEAHRRIYELRKEVKALKRQLAASQSKGS